MKPGHETNLGWISATTFCNATGHLWSVIGWRHESNWSIDLGFQQKPVACKLKAWRPQCVARGDRPTTDTNHSQGFDEVWRWLLLQSVWCPSDSKDLETVWSTVVPNYNNPKYQQFKVRNICGKTLLYRAEPSHTAWHIQHSTEEQ